MVRNILIGILAIGIIATGVWGYQEHKEKNALLIQAESNYQRAFHDLTYYIDRLHDEIGTTLAMNSRESLSPALIDVWRLASEAQNSVGQLPLTLMPFNKTEEFLSKIGDFTYRTAVRDLEKEPLTEEEYNTLKTLYTQAEEIQQELRQLQYTAMKNNLRWMDVELALASGKENIDNTLIDGLQTVEKKVEGYSETDSGVTFASLERKHKGLKDLDGKEISEEEAKKIAKFYANAPDDVTITVEENGDGADYSFYSIHIKGKKGESFMDITKVGGHPIWLITNREIKEANYSLNEATELAKQYLHKHGFENMELLESSQYDNIGVFTFVTTEEGVRIYPDTVKMKIALDDASVVGFSAEDYLIHHGKRDIPEPVISEEEARKAINPNVEIMESGLAIIENDLDEEILVYEFLGTLEKSTYRIFINATTGKEEKVEKLTNAEPVYEEVLDGKA
ncbi:MAG: germination protein YpeB [Caldibacillus sp.]